MKCWCWCFKATTATALHTCTWNKRRHIITNKCFRKRKALTFGVSLLVADSPFGRVCQSGRYMAPHAPAHTVSRCFDEADSVMTVWQQAQTVCDWSFFQESNGLTVRSTVRLHFPISSQVALRCCAGQDLIPSTSPKYIQAAAFRTPWAISRIPHALHHQDICTM